MSDAEPASVDGSDTRKNHHVMMLNFELSVVNHLTNSLRIQCGCRRLHSNGSEDRIISCDSFMLNEGRTKSPSPGLKPLYDGVMFQLCG